MNKIELSPFIPKQSDESWNVKVKYSYIEYVDEVIKEIDRRIENANNGLIPRDVYKVIEAQGVSIKHYFEMIKTYLEFVREDVIQKSKCQCEVNCFEYYKDVAKCLKD